MTDKTMEICKNLKKTIDTMKDKNVIKGNSILKKGDTIWQPCRASKSALVRKLEYLMKKNNITYEQLKGSN